jgi:hypothetical protein
MGTPTATASSSSSMTASSGNVLTLTVNASVLSQAPAFDASAFNGTVNPDVAQFWSSQGMSIPVTGANSGGNSAALIKAQMNGSGQYSVIDFNAVDNSGQAFGQVQDFIANEQTGDMRYAVLTGGTLGSNFYPVPMNVLTWQASGQNSASSGAAKNLTLLQANVSVNTIQSAPSVSSLDQLNLNSPGWNSNIDSYWSSVK